MAIVYKLIKNMSLNIKIRFNLAKVYLSINIDINLYNFYETQP